MKQMKAFGITLVLTFLVTPLALADTGAAHKTKQTPPVKMGTSGGSANDISSAFCCGGTLGSLVMRDGVLHILSNNHILARSGSATVGEGALQPGLIDTGCRSTDSNIVGDFAGDIVPLRTANVDAAISTARSNVDTSGAILDIGVPCSNTQNATVGLPVMKSGRTTGLTTSTVQAVNVNVQIRYQKGCGSGKKFTATYTNQIATGNMSAGGDSGSLLVSDDGTSNPVGLLYAGSSTLTIHNPIQDVVNAFSAGGHTFSFVGNVCPASSTTTLASSTTRRPHGPPDSAIEIATRAKERHASNLMKHPNVLGVGVGASDEDPSEAVIVLFVEQGKPIDQPLPTELDGIKVKVILTDPIEAQ